MSNNYLIAVCDILGFSNLINSKSNDLELINEKFLGFLKRSVLHSSTKNNFPTSIPTLNEIRNHSDLGIAWFSDTILIYTKNDTDEECSKLLSTIGWLIFENMNSNNTRLRVGISFGSAIMDEINETYIGLPIVEAYQLEKKQKWSGGALTKKVEDRFGSYLASLNPYESWVVPYSVPMEFGNRENLLAINWTLGIHNASDWCDFQWKVNQKEPSAVELNKYPDIIEKWINTKEFHSKNCLNCFPDLNPDNIIKPPGKFW